MKDLRKQIDELKKQNEKLTNEKHELDKELQNQKFEVSKSIKYENQLNYDTKELKLKHKKEMAALKEIHDVKYKAMQKVEQRLLEDLAMYERREDQRVQQLQEVFDQKIELLKREHQLDIRDIMGSGASINRKANKVSVQKNSLVVEPIQKSGVASKNQVASKDKILKSIKQQFNIVEGIKSSLVKDTTQFKVDDKNLEKD